MLERPTLPLTRGVDKTMIRLLLVESQPAVRKGLRMRLNVESDVSIVGETGDGLTALWQASTLRRLTRERGGDLEPPG